MENDYVMQIGELLENYIPRIQALRFQENNALGYYIEGLAYSLDGSEEDAKLAHKCLRIQEDDAPLISGTRGFISGLRRDLGFKIDREFGVLISERDHNLITGNPDDWVDREYH